IVADTVILTTTVNSVIQSRFDCFSSSSSSSGSHRVIAALCFVNLLTASSIFACIVLIFVSIAIIAITVIIVPNNLKPSARNQLLQLLDLCPDLRQSRQLLL